MRSVLVGRLCRPCISADLNIIGICVADYAGCIYLVAENAIKIDLRGQAVIGAGNVVPLPGDNTFVWDNY